MPRGTSSRRGAVALYVVLLLPVLIGFGALAIDIGHGVLVRAQLSHAADSAALAACSPLLGTRVADPVNTGKTYAVATAAANEANGQPVDDVDPDGDIVTGTWDWEAGTFTAEDEEELVNAMLVRTAREDTRGTAIDTFFAPLLGVASFNAYGEAIAAAGGPSRDRAFPIAIPLCSIVDGDGIVDCSGTPITLDETVFDNGGLTGLIDGSSTLGDLQDLINDYDPEEEPNLTATSTITIEDTVELNELETELDAWLGETVTLPVLDDDGTCQLQVGNQYRVVGFTAFTINEITYGPGTETLEGVVDCEAFTPHRTAGTRYLGLAARPRLVQ